MILLDGFASNKQRKLTSDKRCDRQDETNNRLKDNQDISDSSSLGQGKTGQARLEDDRDSRSEMSASTIDTSSKNDSRRLKKRTDSSSSFAPSVGSASLNGAERRYVRDVRNHADNDSVHDKGWY